jgi:Flp pilus assembly protein TadD
MLALREAAHADEGDARLWVFYGMQCIRTGRIDAARQALGHAIWLRERQHEAAKAAVTRRLLDSL